MLFRSSGRQASDGHILDYDALDERIRERPIIDLEIGGGARRPAHLAVPVVNRDFNAFAFAEFADGSMRDFRRPLRPIAARGALLC